MALLPLLRLEADGRLFRVQSKGRPGLRGLGV